MVRSDRNRVILGAVVIVGVFVYARTTAAPDDPEQHFLYDDERIVESSGLAASAIHDGIIYTHNDSDDGPYVFAVDAAGTTRAVITLRAAEARDWEAIAVGEDGEGEPAIYVADIGDNLGGEWEDVSVYRIPEPRDLENVTVEATRFQFTYEDGARDAEAMLIDPRDNRMYIASKEDGGGGLYRAPAELSTSDVNELERVADVPRLVTDGAFAPDGETFVLRDYLSAHLYAEPGREIETVLLPFSAQGEAIAYTADGEGWLVGSEGEGSPVWLVPVPDGDDDEANADPTPPDESRADGEEPTAAPADDSADGRSLVVWGNAIALAVAVLAIVGLVRVIRQRKKPC